MQTETTHAQHGVFKSTNMKSRHLILLIATLLSAVANAQVINSINDQNMRIPKGEKPKQSVATRTKPSNVAIDTTSEYYNYIDSAQIHIKGQDWAKAEYFLRNAIKADPTNHNNSLILSNIGTIQRYQGKVTQAIKNYSLALDMTPNSVTILLNRAAAYMTIDSIELSRKDYARVAELDLSNTESRYNLGIISIQRRDYKKAEDLFMEITKISPNSALAQEGLGKLNEVNGNYAKAVDHYSKIIKVRPSTSILANRAHCYLMMKRLNDAEDDIRSGLQIDSNDGYLYLLRALLNKLRFNTEDMGRDIKLAEQHGISAAEVKELLKIMPSN